ncbi:two-component sensor histidine kinase [Streptomyces spinoverrucosus]|uniref:histidine kinase n=1 Tax=Streptomyces spinoverrucosus TaxID=284043 RepID=A0A4Y3VRV7_9ACTN|nr:sensor histidine kinase [Streptomyces spinoverrucosus]GEC09762.1 two-component sensor histidine kinase [Streptomyces spinoverrucosus]GHB52178.1 two-component sensor histidine kinase [Streptomyces spinoverrucosus]
MGPVAQEQTAEPLTQYVHRMLRRVRAFDRRHPLAWDLHLTGFCVSAALIDWAGDGWRNIARNPEVPGWLVLTLSLGLTVPLLWRRTHPRTVLLAMAPMTLANAWTGATLQAALLQLVVLYNIALRLPLRTLWWTTPVVMAPVCVTAVRHPHGSWDQQVVPALMSTALVAVIGIAVRTRRDYTAALEDRARRLEIERDQQARLAAAAERARIAREMHDIIGHNLSVITGLADGGRYAATKTPERATQALQAISTTSRQALTDLRRLLDVLRDEETLPSDPDLTPQPTLTDLDHLIAGVREAGLPVRTTIHGKPTALPPGRQLTVYRVIQEALTNTLKHAGPGATSHIEISYDDGGAVTVTATDTTHHPQAAPRTPGQGRGLTGMHERTALYGGTLEAGPLPHPDHGWRVHLRLPEELPQ